jgi:hypothetical protein
MGDGRRARVRQLPYLGEGSFGSREEEGEGGEGFNIAQTGRRADLLAPPEGNHCDYLCNWENL